MLNSQRPEENIRMDNVLIDSGLIFPLAAAGSVSVSGCDQLPFLPEQSLSEPTHY